jgi:two-component system, NarL family, sensor histidine kinase DesK
MSADRPDENMWTRPGYDNMRSRVVGFLFTAIWLCYLIQPVVELFTDHYSVPYEVVGLATIVLFCAVYLYFVPNWPFGPRYALPGVAVLAGLAVTDGVLFGGTGASTLWIFVSSASGLLITNVRWALRAVLLSSAAYLIFCVTGHVDETDLLVNLLPVLFVGLAMIGLRRQFRLTAELAKAREEVAQLAASEERLRLARDMHDLTGQSLSMITLKSELAARVLGQLPKSSDRDRARDEIEQVAAVSRQTLRDIREAISGYRRPTLAVEIITGRAALASAGIAARDDAELTLLSGTFDPDAEAALAWCLREAVTNVVRHSGAQNCHISLTRHGPSLSLTVRDDGTGHTPPDDCGGGLQPHGSDKTGSGLHGLAERLSAVGGSLELRPDVRPGFCLIATVPAAPVASPAPAKVTSSRA